MFFVKATYCGENRKLTFPTCSTFPPFDELCNQLCRVFPLSQGFTISRLLFSPTPANSIRLLVGQKVLSAEDYLRYLEPYKNRLWPDAMLRLTVLDGGPLNSSTTKKTASNYYQSSYTTDYSVDAQTPLPDHSFSFSMPCIPPPPILFPSYSASTTPIPNATPVCLQPSSLSPNATVSPNCCSNDSSKKDIQALLNGFLHDLNGLLAHTFPVQNAGAPRVASQQDVNETQSCARCKSSTRNTVYYCSQCGASVCGPCFDSVAAAKCSPKAGFHRLERRAFISNHALQAAGPPAPSLYSQPVETPIVETVNSRPTRTSSARGGSSSRSSPRRSTREVVHSAVCDLCDSGIRGIRYKCLVCPDFDTCSSCFVITNEQHPNHSFVKIADPADYIHRLGSRPRHHAICNVCSNVIYGTRYKCVHPDCPDYDLCECCESHPIPLHPANHPVLKLKAADMSVDVLQSRITQHSVTPDSKGTPVVAPPGTESPDVSLEEVTKPSDLATQVESPRTDSFDWRAKFPSPELQVSKAILASPVINGMSTIEKNCEGSETPSTLEYTPSEVPEMRATLLDSPSAQETMSTNTSNDIATGDVPVPAFIPASLAESKLDKEHVPFLAMNVDDATAFSGQILPPGAEFIKAWRVQNTGNDKWPETTELIFTGGDSMTQITAPVLIGSVSPGATVEVSTHLLKAPAVPGNYLSCWSLRALESGTFGDSLWVSVNVVEQSESSEECLSSSSIMKMPRSVSQESNDEMIEDKTASPTASEGLTEETLSDGLGSPVNLSFDGSDYAAEQEEYVILYDDSSSDGE